MIKEICALRGATTISTDDWESITEATIELVQQILSQNTLTEEDFVSIFFTLTQDLTSYNPATAVRKILKWNHTPMICMQEAHIEGGLDRCLRLVGLVRWGEGFTPQHIYLRGAQTLRQDWAHNPEMELP